MECGSPLPLSYYFGLNREPARTEAENQLRVPAISAARNASNALTFRAWCLNLKKLTKLERKIAKTKSNKPPRTRSNIPPQSIAWEAYKASHPKSGAPRDAKKQ